MDDAEQNRFAAAIAATETVDAGRLIGWLCGTHPDLMIETVEKMHEFARLHHAEHAG